MKNLLKFSWLFSSCHICVAGLCIPGWFGPRCQYICHCENRICQTTGDCQTGKKCLPGTFGPACQYVDAVKQLNLDNDQKWLADSDDSTCNPHTKEGDDEITLKGRLFFTWARIIFTNFDAMRTISLKFQNNETCKDMVLFPVNEKTLDIVCYNYQTVTSVVLKGDGIKFLCTVHISGGRNVAPGQYVYLIHRQISVASAYRAIDGNRDQNYHDGNCAISDVGEPWFNLTLLGVHILERIAIYPRMDNGLYYKMEDFILKTFDAKGNIVREHRDKTGNQTLYLVNVFDHTPIQSITLRATNNLTGLAMYLCEFEIYGEPVCQNGTYGRGCREKCSSCTKNQCFVPTGICLLGCPLGKHLLGCNTDCGARYYGLNCLRLCPETCVGALCNSVDGHCLKGCTEGYMGMRCDSECQKGSYGINCSKVCSTGCLNGVCDPKTGLCSGGCAKTHYGEFCSSVCPANCKNSVCSVDGACSEGCVEGFAGLTCEKKVMKKEDSSTDSGSLLLILGLIGLLLLLLIIYFLFRKKPKENKEPTLEVQNENNEDSFYGFQPAPMQPMNESAE